MTAISICVCTFRRPSLAETLASLAALELPADTEIDIVVIDNDDAPSARAVVDAFVASAPVPVRYLHRPGRNISLARNAALDAASGALLAFIDDDERATPSWLTALLSEHARSGAPVVLGPVEAEYGTGAPGWMQRTAVHATAPVWTGGEIRTGYSGNVLIDLRHPALSGLRFDPALGRSGGEDTLYFGAAHARGARIVFAPEAVVSEYVPEARLSLSWLARRKFRMGRTHARILLEVEGRARARALPLAAAKTGYCALAAVAALPFEERRTAAALRGLFHAGVVAGLIGSGRPRPSAALAGALNG
jgi:succinoglycan biosynthesis protein ExoM